MKINTVLLFISVVATSTLAFAQDGERVQGFGPLPAGNFKCRARDDTDRKLPTLEFYLSVTKDDGRTTLAVSVPYSYVVIDQERVAVKRLNNRYVQVIFFNARGEVVSPEIFNQCDLGA